MSGRVKKSDPRLAEIVALLDGQGVQDSHIIAKYIIENPDTAAGYLEEADLDMIIPDILLILGVQTPGESSAATSPVSTRRASGMSPVGSPIPGRDLMDVGINWPRKQ